MWDISLLILKWVLIALALSPIILGFGSVFINGTIRPMLIPKAEIERLASELISKHNDPEEAAAIEEHAAWYRSNNFEQGRWRRVRILLSRIDRGYTDNTENMTMNKPNKPVR